MSEGTTVEQSNLEGRIRISEDVLAQLAVKALASVEGVQPANPGLMANLRLGRKTANGVRISEPRFDNDKCLHVGAFRSLFGMKSTK